MCKPVSAIAETIEELSAIYDLPFHALEKMKESPCDGFVRVGYPAFAALWDSINAKRGYSWADNPYVWVIEFKRIERC